MVGTGMEETVARDSGAAIAARRSGVVDHLADNDEHALAIVRDIVARVNTTKPIDIDLGGSIKLTSKLLDMTFGYKIRNVSVETDSTYQEALYTTYAGLRLSFRF